MSNTKYQVEIGSPISKQLSIKINNADTAGKVTKMTANNRIVFHNNSLHKIYVSVSQHADGGESDWEGLIEGSNKKVKDGVIALRAGNGTAEVTMKIKDKGKNFHFWIHVMSDKPQSNRPDDFDGEGLTKSAEIEVTPP